MTAKTAKPAKALYTEEDLAPRDHAADEAAMDAWIERNKDALNASIRKSRAEYEQGKYRTLDEVITAVKAQQDRRS